MISVNYRLLFLIILFPLVVGIYIGSKYCPNIFAQEPLIKEERKIVRQYDSGGKLANEVIIESFVKPAPLPKPKYKITLFPTYSFIDQKFYYGIGYEKPYTIPILGEVYLGIYINTKLEAGLSLSKEFY